MEVFHRVIETRACLICGGVETKKLYHTLFKTGRESGFWSRSECNGCDLGHEAFQGIKDFHELLCDIQDGKCLYCGAQLIDKVMHRDHIVAESIAYDLGFVANIPSNYALTCPSCNLSKSNIWYEDWIQRKFGKASPEILQRVNQHIAILRRETNEGKWREKHGLK